MSQTCTNVNVMVTTFLFFRNATHRNCTQESSRSVPYLPLEGCILPTTHCPLPTSSVVLKSSSLKPHQMQRGPPSAARWNCLPLTVTWYSNTQWVSQRSHSHIYYLLIKYCKCFKFTPTPFDAPGPASALKHTADAASFLGPSNELLCQPARIA